MGQVFVCPECGTPIALTARTAGRQVRCSNCQTLVELPYLPRTPSKQFWSRRRRRRRWQRRGQVLGFTAALVVALALGWTWARKSWHNAYQQMLVSEIAKAQAAEGRDDPASAFRAWEAARQLAEDHDLEPPQGFEALIEHRNQAARRDVEARLEALANAPPDRAFGEAQTLYARVQDDPALKPLADPVRDALRQATRRWWSHHQERAESLLRSGQHAEALALADRLTETAVQLPPKIAELVLAPLRQFVKRLVDRAGLRFPPIAIEQAIDGLTGDQSDLRAALLAQLRDQGYLPPPDPNQSAYARYWNHAPYRFQVKIWERRGPLYQQSPQRTTQIEADLSLSRSGSVIWQEYLTARTRVPVPGQNALRASRYAMGTKPNPIQERKLYEDARRDLLETLGPKLKRLPQAGDS